MSAGAGRAGACGAGDAGTSGRARGATGAALACDVCPRRCRLAEGALGACRARRRSGGAVVAEGYGRLTSIALDPVEKKPLARWRPGTLVLSVGGYGCNLACPFCQNHEIAQVGADGVAWRKVAPEELVGLAVRERRLDARVTGVAHTYNEPLVCWEYVRDTGRLAHEAGLANVLVTNGCASAGVVDGLAGLVDAANVDLKGFSEGAYAALGAPAGALGAVRDTIERLAADPACHLEVTTLVVPGVNDSEDEVTAMASWLAGLDGGRGRETVTYHVTRFFPRWRLTDRGPTPVATVRRLAEVARRHLAHVRVGNC